MTERARKPMWRRVARVTLIALGSLLLLVVLFVGFLHTGPGQSLVRRQVEHRLSARVNGSVELRELRFSLFGRVKLGGLRIRDASGNDAIVLESLEIVPIWKSLLKGETALERVTLRGLAIAVKKHADGTSSLDELFVKPKEEAPTGPSKPPAEKRTLVKALEIADVSFTLENPDGTKIAVRDVGLKGSIEGVSVAKTWDVHLHDVVAALEVAKKDGPTIAVSGLKTQLDVSMVKGVGKAQLAPFSTHVKLSQSGLLLRETDFAVGGLEVDVEPGKIHALLERLLAGMLALEKIDLRASFSDGTPKTLVGPQHAQILGLHLDAEKLGVLLGKPILASDVDVEIQVDGPTNELALVTKVKTKGGTIVLKGTLDASKLDRLGYDLDLLAENLDSEKLVKGIEVPKVDSKSLHVVLKGKGTRKEEIETDVKLTLGPTTIKNIPIESAELDGRFVRGAVEIKSLVVKVFDVEATVNGTFDTTEKRVKAKVTLHGDVPKAIAKAKAAGIAVPDRVASLGLSNDAVIEVEGKLDESLDVHVPGTTLLVAGGKVAVKGNAKLAKGPSSPTNEKGEKKLALESFDGDIELSGVSLGQLGALAGKKLPVEGVASGKITANGTPTDPALDFALTVHAQKSVKLDVKGHGTKHGIDATIDATEKNGKVFSVKANAPLVGGKLREGPLSVKLDLPKRSIDSIVALLPPALLAGKKLPSGEIEAHVDVHGTTTRPVGTFAIDLGTSLTGTDKAERAKVTGTIGSEGTKTVVSTDTTLWLDAKGEPVATGKIVTKLPTSPLFGVNDYEWSILFDLKPQMIDELPLPMETLAKLSQVNASIGAHVDLHGNRNDAFGEVRLDLVDAIVGLIGPFDAKLGFAIAKADTGMNLDVVFGGTPVVKTTGTVGVPGSGLLASVRAKKPFDPTLALVLEVPEKEISFGTIRGSWKIGGKALEPTIDGALVFDRFATIDGSQGRAALELVGDRAKLRAVLGLGKQNAGTTPVRLEVSTSPNSIIDAMGAPDGGNVDIALLAKAANVDLTTLVPTFAFGDKDAKIPKLSGRLDWDMRGAFGLTVSKKARTLNKAEVNGKLTLTKGSLGIPGSARVYHDVGLELVAQNDPIKTLKLVALESDLQNPKRSLSLSGSMSWDKLTPKSASLDLAASDWLVFGHPKVGPADAPRGSLDADIHVDADLSTHVRSVTANLKKLELKIPDRFARSHFQEVVSLGDVAYLDNPSVTLGKLPIPEKVEKSESPAGPSESEPSPDEEGTDIHVLANKGIRLQQFPLDLNLVGEVHAALRPSGRKVRGKLVGTGGNITVLGKQHPLSKGSIVFDAAHPAGFMDLVFARPPSVSVLREVSLASAGDAVQVCMAGPLDKPRLSFRGVGNAVLFDNASMENDGHLRWKSEPGLPTTATAQGPQMPQIVMSTFMSVNLPHLLFLDRIDYWANPYDARDSYGRLVNLDGEKFGSDGKSRVRVKARPPTAGASDAEIGWDYLLDNSSRTLFGVGVTAGSRIGGGPGLFFEWSSAD